MDKTTVGPPVLRGAAAREPHREVESKAAAAGPRTSYRRVRSLSDSGVPAPGDTKLLVDLFCRPELPYAADRALESTLIGLSKPSWDRSWRRIEPAHLKAIVKPLASNFDRMTASSQHGPYAFAEAMRLTARTLGAARQPATGELLLQQIPASSELSRAAQIQLPGALLHGVAAGSGMGLTERPSPLLLGRLLDPANWHQSPEWIASLFRGAGRAVAPDGEEGLERLLALFDSVCGFLADLPSHAVAPVVQGLLDTCGKNPRFDTVAAGRVLLAHRSCQTSPVRLAAMTLGLARHFNSPAHARWQAFDDLARSAAAESRPEFAFARGCALAWSARAAPALLAEVRENCSSADRKSGRTGSAQAGVDAAIDPARLLRPRTRPDKPEPGLWVIAQSVACLAGDPPTPHDVQALARAGLDAAQRAKHLQDLLAVFPVDALCATLPAARAVLGDDAVATLGPIHDVLHQSCVRLQAAGCTRHPDSEISLRPQAQALAGAVASELAWLDRQPASVAADDLRRRLRQSEAICQDLLRQGSPAPAPAVEGRSEPSSPGSPADSPPGSPSRDIKAAPAPASGWWPRLAKWLSG